MNESTQLPPPDILGIQKVDGALLYYIIVVGATTIHALSVIDSTKMIATQKTAKAVFKLRNYAVPNPDAIVHFQKSDMQL